MITLKTASPKIGPHKISCHTVVSINCAIIISYLYFIIGINATGDILFSVNSSTVALSMSFLILQDSLMNVSTRINALITDCNTAGLPSVCNMIPTDFSTNANADLNNVSLRNFIV